MAQVPMTTKPSSSCWATSMSTLLPERTRAISGISRTTADKHNHTTTYSAIYYIYHIWMIPSYKTKSKISHIKADKQKT